MKLILGLLLAGVLVSLLTGVHHTLEGSTPIVNIVIGSFYCTGVLGFYVMYNSQHWKKPFMRYFMFIAGALCICMAYIGLEMLLKLG